RQAALVQTQVGARHDDGAAGVVDALAEQVLAEAPLLALEHVGQRLERAVARAGHGAATAPVVEQGVDGLLQHPLLVVDDDLRRAEVQESLEPGVPVDDAAVEVVEVRGGEAATGDLAHRAEVPRDDRDRLEDHPLGPVLARDEGVDDLEPLDRPLLLLPLRGADRLAQHRGLGVEVEVLEQLADRLRAHAALEVDAEAVRRAEAVLELAEDLLVVDDQLRLELAEQLPGLLEAADGGARGLLRVVLARLHVLVHLAHLDRPLDDRVEILLGDLPVGAQAEVVRQLTELVRARARLGLLEHLAQEPLAKVARLLELLLVDARDEVDVLLVHRGLRVEQAVEHAVDVLGDRALLGAAGLAELLVERREGLADLDRDVRHRVQLLRRKAAVVANGRVADQLADLLRVLRRDLVRDLDEHLPDELTHLLERRDALLLGPVGQAAAPEVVVL